MSTLHTEAQTWLSQDWERVEHDLGAKAASLNGSRVLLTGAAGFLGFNFLHFLSYLNKRKSEGQPAIHIVAVDNYLRGKSRWIMELAQDDPNIELRTHDITHPWPVDDARYDFIIHGASVASPTFYRQYPLETLDANVAGLRNMLDLARLTSAKSMVFFSSSEIYGDPPVHEIPTKETYRGNVACTGPRACYDESKRLGETLCYIYAQKYSVPVKIIRPFNNYGPGLRLTDRRVLPDICADVLADRDIVLYSDGKATRTFCYSSDALTGYLLALLSTHDGEAFNIGSQAPEVSMYELATMVSQVASSSRSVVSRASDDKDYLTDNPQRRCPDLSKAKTLLGYQPKVDLRIGLTRLIEWYKTFLPLEAVEK
ncbi:MAG: NAD-dependent epimerase/dehydratase family protein [Nitrospira sp.]|nr:NAD-dependent epimerase/dehydratase family protein [Nitrospira sp.]